MNNIVSCLLPSINASVYSEVFFDLLIFVTVEHRLQQCLNNLRSDANSFKFSSLKTQAVHLVFRKPKLYLDLVLNLNGAIFS